MTRDYWNLIEQIELINDYIDEECQEYVYYLPQSNRCVFERIRNASMMLLNNAMRLLRNQTPIIKSATEPLTIERTKELMLKIYQTMIVSEFPIIKENKIKKMMKEEFTVNPDELLQINPPDDREEKRIKFLLNGGI